jgi:integrase
MRLAARPEELLNIRIKDIMFDNKGAKVILRGKTVESVTRVIAYVPY